MKKGFTDYILMAGLLLVLVTVLAGTFAIISPTVTEEGRQLKKFSSVDELRQYLNETSIINGYYGMARSVSLNEAVDTSAQAIASPSAAGSEEKSSYDFSETNIQVEGVDEADFLKNDGKYIYAIYGNNVTIIDAYPAENAKIASRITFENSTPSQIFINQDRLVVFGQVYETYHDGGPLYKGVAVDSISSIRYPYYQTSKTFINIYDISDRSNPVLAKNYTIDGNYYNSRMIGDYVYLITNQYVYDYADPVIPEAAYRCGSGGCFDVWYFDNPDNSHQFTIISSLNIQNPSEPASKVFLMGYTQNLFVSQENIYVVYSKYLSIYDFFDRIADALSPLMPGSVQAKIVEIKSSTVFSSYEKMSAMGRVIQNYTETLGAEERLNLQKQVEEKYENVYDEISKEMEKTIIHKISIANGEIEYKVQGEVPGYTLNQFSMDEYDGNLRIATTTGNWQTTSKNHVYVLDSSLNMLGKVEDLAPGERIYSARFIGEKGYMVTFRQVDPLYVIDLSNPSNPAVMGFLKIPGVSDYLHPYDETHLIGVGRDASEEGRIKGMKLSLFDVSDVSKPVEISKYFIGEQGTYSEALNDHKAFLFSREKGILSIPVSERTDGKYYNTWYGAYVFSLDIENGFTLKGKVTHMNETELSRNESYYYYYDYNSQIRRSLYMDDVLYTVSQRMVKMNSLTDMSEINKIEMPTEDYYYRYYGYAE